jgi:hypothetical protein
VQCGIQGPMLHLKDVVRAGSNSQPDSVPVLRAPLKGSQDQEVQSPLQDLNSIPIWLSLRHE